MQKFFFINISIGEPSYVKKNTLSFNRLALELLHVAHERMKEQFDKFSAMPSG